MILLAQTLYLTALYGSNTAYQSNEYLAYSSAINASSPNVMAGADTVTPVVQL